MVDRFRSSGVPLWVSLPACPHPDTPVIVTVHGISRNALEHAEWLSDAAPADVAVVAPHFDADDFPRYQRLGLARGERRADLWLDCALEALEQASGIGTARFHLFGFSGGAQFAHRYAMLNPGRVRSLHVAAAGYYTFLDETVAWPRGLGRLRLGRQMALKRNFFLRVPIEVYVGSHDIGRDFALRKGPAIDAQQGRTRKARAHVWCAHLRRLQAGLGVRSAGLTILPDTGHQFAEACRAGGLAERVLESLSVASPAG